MSNNSYGALWQVLQGYLISIPVILVHGAGVVVAIMRWNRHPKISKFALAGFGIPLVLHLLLPIINALMISWISERGPSAQYHGLSYSILFSVVHSASSVIAAVGYFMLILASFSDRPNDASRAG